MNLTAEQREELRKALNVAFRRVGESVERDLGVSMTSRYFFAQAHVDHETATKLDRLYVTAFFGEHVLVRAAARDELSRVLDKIEELFGRPV